MAEKKPRKFGPRPAKDESKGGARAKFLEEAKGRKPRPAKDVKPGSLREQATKKPGKSGVPGTSSDSRRFSDVKKSRGPFGQLVPRKENVPAKAEEPKRGIVKYEEPKRGVVKYEGPKPSAGGIVGAGLRALAPAAWRSVGGPATMLVSMTTPAGEGSDKPSGPLMKGGKQPGYKYLEDKKAMPARVNAPARGGGPEKRQGSSAPSIEAPAKPKPVGKPAKAAPAKVAPKVSKPAKAAPKAAPKPTFRGNWAGAAPTAMQSRLGRKVKKGERMGRDR